MVDFARFSLGQTKVTVDRYTGSYTDGIYSYSLTSTFEMYASVQPYSTIEQEQIMDVVGNRIERLLLMYSPQIVYQNSDDGANPTRDLITVEGVKYKPMRVEEWNHLSLNHYRVILRLYDGD